ncbi:MAG: DUF3662 and FHA domain-containing protein [Armatimonadetes bacterium]|nr:DUF3662 and FHA domain-containing protein [Armatimonadota bacterium]
MFLNKLEKVLENLIENKFIGKFGGEAHPLEIAKKLLKIMHSKKVISLNKVFVPNLYKIYLNSKDFKSYQVIKEELIKEWKDFLTSQASSRDYNFLTKLEIELYEDSGLEFGKCKIEGEFSKENQKIKAFLRVIRGINLGENFSLIKGENILGRGEENSIIIGDLKVSKRHAGIYWDEGFILEDLKSKNGTFLNAKKIEEKVKLKDKDKIALGDTILEFFML